MVMGQIVSKWLPSAFTWRRRQKRRLKIAFVSHCGVEDNSGIHISSVAAELIRRGHECAVLVPKSPEGTGTVTAPALQVMGFEEAALNPPSWTSLGGPDLIHAWTPREPVRKAAMALKAMSNAAVVVHMEDNEERVVADHASRPYAELRAMPSDVLDHTVHPGLAHPIRHRQFIEQADGYSCVIDRLLEFKPDGMPGVVFWPGCDERFRSLAAPDAALRQSHGLDAGDILIFYSGNVHRSNVDEIRELYLAVALLRQRGYPAKLVKTGRNDEALGLPPDETGNLVLDLGFVPRSEVPTLLSMCDILVQPGTSGPFNDYRFPSKLPEYLASGKAVVLPDANIGRELEDGRHVLKLESGTSTDIADKVERLINHPALARKLGIKARAFAKKYLSWSRAVDVLEPFYEQVLDRAPRAASPDASRVGGSTELDMTRS